MVDGRACSEVAGLPAAFVSPSNAAVRTRLDILFDELAAMKYFEGVWLDYLRYPLAAESGGEAPDPARLLGLRSLGPRGLRRQAAGDGRGCPRFMAFLKSGEAPDPQTREELGHGLAQLLASELREVLALARARLSGRTNLCMVFHRRVPQAPRRARQDALAWLSYYDEAAAMCYAYDPTLNPAILSLTRAPQSTASWTWSSPRWRASRQRARAPGGDRRRAPRPCRRPRPPPLAGPGAGRLPSKGRRVEGAFPSLEGVALFSYGWLWPQSEAGRRATDQGSLPAAALPPAAPAPL